MIMINIAIKFQNKKIINIIIKLITMMMMLNIITKLHNKEIKIVKIK